MNHIEYTHYIINQTKNVYFFGEVDHRNISLQSHTETIQFIDEKLNNNMNTILFLEYGIDDPNLSLSSVIKYYAKKQVNKYGFDPRPALLKISKHVELYNNPNLNISDKKKIYNDYFIPFYNNYKQIFSLDGMRYNTGFEYYLTHVYPQHVYNCFTECYKYLTDKPQLSFYEHKVFLRALKICWLKITDFNILKYVFNLEIHDIIVVVGNKHKINIDSILNCLSNQDIKKVN